MKIDLTDELLIQKVCANDMSAFEMLVDRHRAKAFQLSYRVVGNREDAEEVAHDALLQVYKKAKSFKGQSKFTTWLYRLVMNQALMRIRRKKLETYEIGELGVNEPYYNDGVVSTNERERFVIAAVRQLAAEDRMLIALYYFDELSLEEIVGITGMKKNTLKVRIFRARKKLSENLDRMLKTEVSGLI